MFPHIQASENHQLVLKHLPVQRIFINGLSNNDTKGNMHAKRIIQKGITEVENHEKIENSKRKGKRKRNENILGSER